MSRGSLLTGSTLIAQFDSIEGLGLDKTPRLEKPLEYSDPY